VALGVYAGTHLALVRREFPFPVSFAWKRFVSSNFFGRTLARSKRCASPVVGTTPRKDPRGSPRSKSGALRWGEPAARCCVSVRGDLRWFAGLQARQPGPRTPRPKPIPLPQSLLPSRAQ
jgi:hypothetical protein